MTKQEFEANLLFSAQVVARTLCQDAKTVVGANAPYDASEICITGRPRFVTSGGSVFKNLSAVEKAMGTKLYPKQVTIIPETAELKLTCLQRHFVQPQFHMDDAERRDLGEDEANIVEGFVDEANEDYAFANAVELVITGSFTAVTASLDVCTCCELHKRSMAGGRETLTTLEAGEGFRTRELRFRKGEDTARVVYYECAEAVS